GSLLLKLRARSPHPQYSLKQWEYHRYILPIAQSVLIISLIFCAHFKMKDFLIFLPGIFAGMIAKRSRFGYNKIYGISSNAENFCFLFPILQNNFRSPTIGNRYQTYPHLPKHPKRNVSQYAAKTSAGSRYPRFIRFRP